MWLAMITARCLLPFANQSFHIDDPLFLWTTRQIEGRPGNFHGFTVSWCATEKPMAKVTKNPPLAAY